ncbi:hypothetical protein NKDENANG_01742 [Candidatus Entotheonellaceae bacterium PAL068K]
MPSRSIPAVCYMGGGRLRPKRPNGPIRLATATDCRSVWTFDVGGDVREGIELQGRDRCFRGRLLQAILAGANPF